MVSNPGFINLDAGDFVFVASDRRRLGPATGSISMDMVLPATGTTDDERWHPPINPTVNIQQSRRGDVRRHKRPLAISS